MKWGWDVKWTGLGCRNMSRSFFPTCEGSQCLSCGAVMCQLRFWNFKQWPPASAHGHKSSSGKKMKNYLWTQSFCVRGFLFPSEMGRFHLFFLGPNGDSHRDAVSVNGRNTCSNFSLEPSRMILLNCARWWHALGGYCAQLVSVLASKEKFPDVTSNVPRFAPGNLVCYMSCSQTLPPWQR